MRPTTQARGVGDETAMWVGAGDVGKGVGMAGEERGSGWVVTGAVVAAGRALDPGEVAAGVGDEEEVLGWGSYGDSDEVLAGANGGARYQRGFEAEVEGRDAAGVKEEDLGRGVGVGNVD